MFKGMLVAEEDTTENKLLIVYTKRQKNDTYRNWSRSSS